MKFAWNDFATRPGSFARGRKSRNRIRFSYGQVQRYFPGANFRALQAQLVAIDAAQHELGRLRAENVAAIRRRLPDRAQRRQRRGLMYEI
jgi:hypothetical protein